MSGGNTGDLLKRPYSDAGSAVPHDRPRHWHTHAQVLPQVNAYAMIRRRAAAAGIETKLGNHSFSRLALPTTSKTAAGWKKLLRWRAMRQRARRSFITVGFMTVGAMRCASMNSSGI